jgi:hypothetical protein
MTYHRIKLTFPSIEITIDGEYASIGEFFEERVGDVLEGLFQSRVIPRSENVKGVAVVTHPLQVASDIMILGREQTHPCPGSSAAWDIHGDIGGEMQADIAEPFERMNSWFQDPVVVCEYMDLLVYLYAAEMYPQSIGVEKVRPLLELIPTPE